MFSYSWWTNKFSSHSETILALTIVVVYQVLTAVRQPNKFWMASMLTKFKLKLEVVVHNQPNQKINQKLARAIFLTNENCISHLHQLFPIQLNEWKLVSVVCIVMNCINRRKTSRLESESWSQILFLKETQKKILMVVDLFHMSDKWKQIKYHINDKKHRETVTTYK